MVFWLFPEQIPALNKGKFIENGQTGLRQIVGEVISVFLDANPITEEIQMKVLIVYAHPNPKSFNHAILESFTEGLTNAGHTYEIVDLYAINFNPILSGADFAMLMEGKTPEDIAVQQGKVSQADAIVFIHPVWWVAAPAILKGWIDRVFSMGFAYSSDGEGPPVGLLKHKKALTINTLGATKEDAKMSGITEVLQKAEDDYVFRFCGINDVQHVFFYNVMNADESILKGFLDESKNLGEGF